MRKDSPAEFQRCLGLQVLTAHGLYESFALCSKTTVFPSWFRVSVVSLVAQNGQ